LTVAEEALKAFHGIENDYVKRAQFFVKKYKLMGYKATLK
jgi:hypothetical protein